MKTTLFRFGRTAACLTLAVALLTGCSLLPAGCLLHPAHPHPAPPAGPAGH